MPGHVKTMLHLLTSDQAVHSFGGQKVPKTGFLVIFGVQLADGEPHGPNILQGILSSDIRRDSNQRSHRFFPEWPTGRIRRERVGCAFEQLRATFKLPSVAL
jgi:hypothetical protein